MRSVSRLVRPHPGYVAMATIVLTASIGVNLLVFTVVNALWLRPLPFPEPHRVVTIPQITFIAVDDDPAFRVFEGGVAGQVLTDGQNEALQPRIEIGGQPLETLGVTSGYFHVLRLAIRGRDFTVDDERDRAEPVAIISDRLWSRTFERRPDVIGSVVPATPVPIRIVGVAPPDFHGVRRGERADVWIPRSLVRRLASPGWSGSYLPTLLYARLGPEQTIARVQEQFALLEPGMLDFRATVTPVTEVFGTPASPTSLIREGGAVLTIAGLALLVLLAGCATVAALVLMHYERRRGELALKLSLGIGRRRLVLELARDLTWLAAAGCTGGLLMATLGVRLIPAVSLPGGVDITRLDLSIDWRVAAVAIAVTLLTLVSAAALPIARSTRERLGAELVAGPSVTTRGSLRTRQTLLALQVCATVIVMIAAGLFVRGVMNSFGSAAGFDIDRTVFVSVQQGSPQTSTGGNPQPLIAERDARLTAALQGLPGVNDVAVGRAPIGPGALASGRPSQTTVLVGEQEYELSFGILSGGPNLLSALGVPVLAGRSLTSADLTAERPRPAVMTRSLAERLWPDGGALGQTLSTPQLRGGPYLVVGIVRDLSFGSLTSPVSGVIVTAGSSDSAIVSRAVIRTERPDTVAAIVRRTIEGQVVRAATGREIVAHDIGRLRLGAWFFSGFGLAALLLGIAGVFGLVAYLSETHRREFGVRMALGAGPRDLVRQGVGAALVPVSAGVAAGLAFGSVVSQAFRALLVGIGTLDPATYVGVAIAMLSCATMAALAAAWRIGRTSPADALRTF